MRSPDTPPPSRRDVDALHALLVDLVDGRSAGGQPSTAPPELVGVHGLAPLAYRYGHEIYKPDYLATALAAELRERVLAEALDTLAEIAVPVMLLKGIAYVQDIYDDPAERPMTDIDLMVPPDRHANAVDALVDIGFSPGPKQTQRAAVHHALTLHRSDCDVDLHRRMIQPKRSDVDIAAVWSRTVSVPGLRAVRPDAVDEVMFHLTHIGRHEMNVPAISYLEGARLLANLEADGLLPELDSRATRYRLSRLIGFARKTTEALCRGDTEIDIPQPWRRLMPTPREILAGVLPPRPLQLARKAALTEGPRELFGLATVYALAQAQRFRR